MGKAYYPLYLWFLLLLVWADTKSAYAQGGLSFQLGGAEASPICTTPAAIFWNPAALGLTKGMSFLTDIQTVMGQGTYQRSPDFNSSFYPEVTANVLFPIPFFGVVNDFGLEKWRFGLGTYLPFGGGGSWDASGPQRYHLIKGVEASIFVTGTATYKVTNNFFAGLGASYIFSMLQGEISFDLASTVQGFIPPSFGTIPAEDPLFEAHIETGLLTAHNFTFNGGLFYQPTPNVDLGLSFLLPVNIKLTGPIDVTLPDVAGLAQPILEGIGFDGRTVRADGQVSFLRPAMIMAASAWRTTPRLTLEGMIIYSLSSYRDTFRSELTNTGIPYLDAPDGTSNRDTGAENSYQLRLGSKYRINRELDIAGYLSFIKAGIPTSHVTASNIGFDLLVPTWLVKYRPNQQDIFNFSLSPIFPLPREVNDSVFDSNAPAGSGIGIPPGNGSYRGIGLQIGLSYNRHF